MQHDTVVHDAARLTYVAVYPSEDWAPVGCDEAEQRETVHYRQAIYPAVRARRYFGMTTAQLLWTSAFGSGPSCRLR